jgi:hypothetical protein
MIEIIIKNSIAFRIYIWLYRLLFITFGGITIRTKETLTVNKFLKIYGYFGGIIITLLNIIYVIYVKNSKQMSDLYESGFVLIYYLIALKLGLQSLHISAIVWYLNRNGFMFFKISNDIKISIKSKYLLFIAWICHILLPITVVVISFLRSKGKCE